MRVLMLGWEFPPSITGGLGTACSGLVHAMDAMGVDVTFVMPQAPTPPVEPADPYTAIRKPDTSDAPADFAAFEHVTFRTVPVRLSPYETEPFVNYEVSPGREPVRPATTPVSFDDAAPPPPAETGLLADVRKYTELVEEITAGEAYDVVHAHDWMTYPAGLAVAARLGVPLVAHVHSTETDRAGSNGDSRIAAIERRGVHAAVRVIAVSHYTKSLLHRVYGVAEGKVDVVYNAVVPPPGQRLASDTFAIRNHEKIVLFLGRITQQKGPEYFLTAARKVLEVMDDVKFIVAGDGDLARHTVELAATFGIAHKVLFTGFLRGLDVERIFQIADLFVMPSVSEPFGIASLEAVARNVPTIISKQSGVSEVLKHALKVDFWDTNELANKIVSVLRYPTLASMLKEEGGRDVAKLSWDAAARSCLQIYGTSIASMPTPLNQLT